MLSAIEFECYPATQMNTKSFPKICVYCGNEVHKIGKGEHIVPEAIGGALTIKNVCQHCNNDILSPLDKELCSRSPLSIIASQEIDTHIWQTWDVDHASQNLLVEAMPIWDTKSYKQYPQIIFERHGPQIRGDLIEMQQFGYENYKNVLIKSMLKAYRRNEAGEDRWLHLEHIESNSNILYKYRFPPRIFCYYSIGELAKRMVESRRASFVMRYLNRADRRFALNVIDNWNFVGGFRKRAIGIGSYHPEIRCFCEITKTLRALAKIAINMLVEFCPNTLVNRIHFGDLIKIIVGDSPVTTELLQASGFVNPSEIESIKCPNGGHSFRLFHMDRQWHIISSFFGGRIGSFIKFYGPNNEDWCCADILAPLRSKDWSVTTSKILKPPYYVSFGWQDLKRIIPSLEINNLQSELHVYTNNGIKSL